VPQPTHEADISPVYAPCEGDTLFVILVATTQERPMTPDTVEKLDLMFLESPVMRAEDVPSVQEVETAEQQIGVPFPDDYREFLLRYGGAMVGPYPIFGLRPCHVMGDDQWSVINVTDEYRCKFRRAGIDCISNWIVFSEDHGGNPVGMDATSTVWIHDHDFGGLSELAAGFEDYIRTHCLKVS